MPKSAAWSVPGAPQIGQRKAPPPTDESPAAKDPTPPAAGDDRRWSVLLMSFTGDDHRQLAITACEQIRKRHPTLAEAFVRTKTKGSVVVVGRFKSPKDPEAKPTLKNAQSVVDGGVRPFARAMLTRWESSRDQNPGPLDLRHARVINPEARRLYSMEVAVWSDFGSAELSVEEIRKKAEAHTRQLRTQGIEAYYFHDDDKRMSIVTIGVFGEDAYNPQTMLYSDAVEAVKKRYPNLLVNGEELMRLKRPGSSETTPEQTLLVEVPQ
ncbi:MAG: hypothetical protein EXS03_06885 [Phycisphaerales bacterium]|nr:hypothetical protein [Phycisphaerales bacterium]